MNAHLHHPFNCKAIAGGLNRKKAQSNHSAYNWNICYLLVSTDSLVRTGLPRWLLLQSTRILPLHDCCDHQWRCKRSCDSEISPQSSRLRAEIENDSTVDRQHVDKSNEEIRSTDRCLRAETTHSQCENTQQTTVEQSGAEEGQHL